MKKTIYIVWESKENAENVGCWYDDMKIKVFNTKKEAEDYCSKFDDAEEENAYCGIVKKTIVV